MTNNSKNRREGFKVVVQDRWSLNSSGRYDDFDCTSRAITLLFQNEISPLPIPYHSSSIPMSMQSLKKIGQKVLKLEHGNEALTDRRMDDGRTDTQKFGGYNIIPRHFLCGGV